MRQMILGGLVVLIVAALLTTACGSPTSVAIQTNGGTKDTATTKKDTATVPAPPGPVSRVDILGGNAQQDTVGRELTQVVRVKAVDSIGRAIKGQIINFIVTKGGGHVFAGSASTSDSGTAAERWTLGTAAVAQELEARAVDQTTGAPLVFARLTATAVPSHPKTLALSSAIIGGFLGTKLSLGSLVTVKDTFANMIAAPTLTFMPYGAAGLKADTVSATGEVDDSVLVQSGQASGRIRVALLRDFRLNRWQATYTCFSPSPYATALPDSIAYRLASDSIVYGVLPGAGGFNGTFWTYTTGIMKRWFHGGTVDSITGHHAEWAVQIAGQLQWSGSLNGVGPAAGIGITAGDSVTGGHWPCTDGTSAAPNQDGTLDYAHSTTTLLKVAPQ